MDDISNVTANADDTATGVTMYLSFDADNTLSSTAFQTLENTIEQEEHKNVVEISPLINDHANKTLESGNNFLLGEAGSDIASSGGAQAPFIKAMQSMSITNKKLTPIRGLPRNVLKDFNAKSSTPTNAQINAKLDIPRKVEKIIVAEKKDVVDLGLAFNNIEAVKPLQQMQFGVDVVGAEQKENSQADISNASTLSISSMLERKLVLSTTEENSSIVELKTNKSVEMLRDDAAMQTKDEMNNKSIPNVDNYDNEKVANEIFGKNGKIEQTDEVVTMLNKVVDVFERKNEPVVIKSDMIGKPVLEKGKSSEKTLKLIKEQNKENKQPTIKVDKMHENQSIKQYKINDVATVVPTKMHYKKDDYQLEKQLSCDKIKQKAAEAQQKYKQNEKITEALEEQKQEKPMVVAVAAENGAAIKVDVNKESAKETVEAQDKLDTAAVSAETLKIKFDLPTVVQILIHDDKGLPKVVVSDHSDHSNNEDKIAIQLPTKVIVDDKSKLRRSFIPAKNIPKLISEPDLKTNRPSRIVNKRISLMPSMPLKPIIEQKSKISDLDLKKSVEQPTISLTGKISNNDPSKKSINDDVKQTTTTTTTTKMSEIHFKKPIACNEEDKSTIKSTQQNKRRSVAVAKKSTTNTRASLLPTTNQYLKPTLNVNTRRSVLFTNAANSPARKILRRSINVINGSPITKSRRSVLATSKCRSAVNLEKPLPATAKEVVPNKRKSLHPTASFRGTTTTNTQKTHATLTATLSAPADMQLNAAGGAIKKEKTFTCNICTAKFRIKSLLDAHKRTHEDALQIAVTKKSTTTTATTNNSAQNVQNVYIVGTSNQCKYCDKKFALLRALHIHLMVNCPKIPPKEKRKLDFTEMDHVGKAQLPHFVNAAANNNGNSSNVNSNSSSLISLSTSIGAQDSLLQKLRASNLSSAAASEDESLNEKSEITVIVNEINALFEKTMAPPNTNRVKRSKIPGMFGTPKKTIKCHLCNECFINVLDYTDHSMSKHSSNTNTEKSSLTVDKVDHEHVDVNKNSTTEAAEGETIIEFIIKILILTIIGCYIVSYVFVKVRE